MTSTERQDYLPGCKYKIWQDSQEFCFTTDAVFLSAFAHLPTKAKVLELGSGTGAISLFMAARGAEKVVGVDQNEHVVSLMQRSIDDNNLQDKVSVIHEDIRNLKKYYQAESFDVVLANPPYRNAGNTRKIGTAACHEVVGSLEDFFKIAAYSVKYRGRFAMVQLPERFTECMEFALKYGLQPKRLQWVHAFVDKPAWIFLMEMVKGGSYGMDVLPPLIMYNADGSYTEDVKKYYSNDDNYWIK